MRKRIFMLAAFAICISSCRYEKPFISVTWLYRETTDTITKQKTVTGVFNYISFKDGLSKGVGTFYKIYRENGRLAYSELLKEGHGNSSRRNTQYIKEVSYDTLGQAKRVHYQKKRITAGNIKILVDKTLDVNSK